MTDNPREIADGVLFLRTMMVNLYIVRTPDSWVLVTTSGFEFVRPTPEWDDRRPVFAPNSVIAQRQVG